MKLQSSRAGVILVVQLQLKDLSNLTHIIVDRPHFLMGFWPEAALSFSLVSFSTGQLITWKLTSPEQVIQRKEGGRGRRAERQTGREREPNTEVSVLLRPDLGSDIASLLSHAIY